MEYTEESLQAYLRANFAPRDIAYIMDSLRLYGIEPGEAEKYRVYLALLKMCEGNVDLLPRLVERAKRDYRDVLFEAENYY